MRVADLRILFERLFVCSNLRGVKVAYALVKNERIIHQVMKPVWKEINELHLKNCKMKDGKPVIKDDKFVMKNPAKHDEEYLQIANREIDVELHMITMADLPNDITAEQMAIILPMIKDAK